MPCTQDAPLHFTESDDNQLNRKRSRETTHRLYCAVNRGTVQSIRANEKHITNPSTIDFFPLDSKPFFSENHCKFSSFAKYLQFHLKNRLDNIHRIWTTGSSSSGYSKRPAPF